MSMQNRRPSFIIREEKRVKNLEKIFNKIKQLETEEIELEKYMHSKDISECLQSILSKEQRQPHELYIIKTYISHLSNFMSILQTGKNEKRENEILSRISKELVIESHIGNSFLMTIGEIGETFYFTLKGEVIVLVPKTFQSYMNRDDYKNHLKYLYNCNERYLLEKTYNENINIFQFDKNEIESYDSTIKVNKSNLDNYLNKINAETIIEQKESKSKINLNMILKKENEYHKVNIVGYFKVSELSEGSTFGEIALINEDSKRTASIYVKEDSVFGTLTAEVYRELIRDIQRKNKKEQSSFIFSTQLFKNVNNHEILKVYWHYFIERNVNKGDFIFKSGFERDEIYFLREGEIKLFIPKLNYKKINKYIDHLQNKTHFINEEYDKESDVVISIVTKGEILGLDEFIYNNKLFISGICESDTAKIFVVDVNIIKGFFEHNESLYNNWKEVIKFKKSKMIKRLNEIRISFKNSVEGEIKKDEMIKNNKIKHFFATKENMIETKEAKINMLKSYQGKFELHSLKSEPIKERRKSLHNTPRISIVENSPSNINSKIMSIPLSQTPNLREFKPNSKYDKKPEANINKINSKDGKRRNSIKKNNLDIIKKRRGTVKENDFLNIQKLLNSDINIDGSKNNVNDMIFKDNISEILINNNQKRGNNKRRNTVNIGLGDAQIRKLKSKFAPSDL